MIYYISYKLYGIIFVFQIMIGNNAFNGKYRVLLRNHGETPKLVSYKLLELPSNIDYETVNFERKASFSMFAPRNLQCPTEFVPFKKHCWKKTSNQSERFQNAKDSCQQLQAKGHWIFYMYKQSSQTKILDKIKRILGNLEKIQKIFQDPRKSQKFQKSLGNLRKFLKTIEIFFSVSIFYVQKFIEAKI